MGSGPEGLFRVDRATSNSFLNSSTPAYTGKWHDNLLSSCFMLPHWQGSCLTWCQETEAAGKRNFAGKRTSARTGHWSEHNRSSDT